jgi:hypothetical protein
MNQTQLIIAASLTLASISIQAQLANYESTVNGQSPSYFFTFNNSSLSDSLGSGATFSPSSGATFGSDYFGNANNAALLPALTDNLSIASPNIISGADIATAIGSISMLFYLSSTVPNTGYLFSEGDATSGSYFAFDISGGNTFQLKMGNTTKSLTGAPAITTDTWYYLALSYNRNGVVTGVNGVNWYLGAAGGSLESGFFQNGGTGNISATSTLGDGGTFILDNRRAENNSMGLNSEVDELATWNTALTSSQITSQFDAVAVPEPANFTLFAGLGGLLLIGARRFICFGAIGRQ